MPTPPTNTERKWTPEELRAIVGMWFSGKSQALIAEVVGCADDTLANLIVKLRLPARREGRDAKLIRSDGENDGRSGP